jgi:hypothetical protein
MKWRVPMTRGGKRYIKTIDLTAPNTTASVTAFTTDDFEYEEEDAYVSVSKTPLEQAIDQVVKELNAN